MPPLVFDARNWFMTYVGGPTYSSCYTTTASPAAATTTTSLGSGPTNPIASNVRLVDYYSPSCVPWKIYLSIDEWVYVCICIYLSLSIYIYVILYYIYVCITPQKNGLTPFFPSWYRWLPYIFQVFYLYFFSPVGLTRVISHNKYYPPFLHMFPSVKCIFFFFAFCFCYTSNPSFQCFPSHHLDELTWNAPRPSRWIISSAACGISSGRQRQQAP